MFKEEKAGKINNINEDIKYYANKLAKLLADSDEFADYCVARDNLQKDADYSYLLADFRQQQLQLQLQIHLASLAGEDASEDTYDIEAIYQDLSEEPVISEFLFAETRLYTLLSQVQKILGKDLDLWLENDVFLPNPNRILN